MTHDKRNVPRILIDRSTFHGPKFRRLKTSGLLRSAQQGDVKIYYTLGFIEETLRNLVHHAKTLSDEWKYICDLNHSLWFRHPNEIIRAECTHQAREGYYLRSEEDIAGQIEVVSQFLSGKRGIEELQGPFDATQRIRESDEKLRRKILNLREERSFGAASLDEFVRDNAVPHFKSSVLPRLGLPPKFGFGWDEIPEGYPFTRMYVKAKLCVLWLPLIDKQLAVDRNDRSDAEQLAYALWADTLVTDDLKFMSKAFGVLYDRATKNLWSLDNLLLRYPLS